MGAISDCWNSTKAKASKVWEDWQGSIILGIVVVVACCAAFSFALIYVRWLAESREAEKVLAAGMVTLFTIFGLFLVVTFFWVFRGKATEEKLGHIITYCYAFIIFSLSASVLPFFALPIIPELYSSMTKSPIGIVAGCSLPMRAPAVQGAAPEDKAKSPEKSVPRELRCEDNVDQWVVNIGGTVGEELGGHKGYNLVRISGGLVIPLYVIVLALMGATVSMTRRVPEFQRRITTGDAEHMTYEQAREGLVFQIMQVASAPLIAITAYYLVDPESRASTIVLSFASGFSSETVLLLIRAFLEKFKPMPANPVTRSAVVSVAPARVDFGNVKVNGSERKSVSISNPGPATLVVSSLGSTGEFTVVTKAPLNVSANSSGVVEVEFKPTSAAAKQGQLTITDNATGSPRTVELTGTGTAA